MRSPGSCANVRHIVSLIGTVAPAPGADHGDGPDGRAGEAATQSVLNALRVVEQVSTGGGVGVSELARQLDLPKSTVQRTLLTLRAAGWVRQDASARWVLTLRCAVIGRRAVPEHAVHAVAHPIATELRDRTHETVRCFLVEGSQIVLVDTVESDHAVRPVETDLPGGIPLHATAIGKASLAAGSPAQLDAVLRGRLHPVTPRTITDPDRLRAEIEATRRRGWGVVREELYLDVGGVAAVAPIYGETMIGVGVSYPLHRAGERTINAYGRMVADATIRLAKLIGPRRGT